MAHIMVVDDEHTIRLMVRLALQHVGHSVETAVDGADALELFGDGSGWDLMLLDQRMPGMEGIEVLRALRERRPDARVIMITAYGTLELAALAVRLGALDLLRKPFTAETLRGAVQTALTESSRSETALGSAVPVTVNGFRILSRDPIEQLGADGHGATCYRRRFSVRGPSGASTPCVVEIAPLLAAQAAAHAGSLCLGADLWSSMCEEVLANYVWQQAELPSEGYIVAHELTSGMRRLIETAATSESNDV